MAVNRDVDIYTKTPENTSKNYRKTLKTTY